MAVERGDDEGGQSGDVSVEALAAARTAAQRAAENVQFGATAADGSGGEGGYNAEEQPRKRKRRSRWEDPGEEQQKALEAVDKTLQTANASKGGGMQVSLPDAEQIKAHLAGQGMNSQLSSDDPEVHRLHAKLMDVNQRIQAGDFTDSRPDEERSPSPEPIYDSEGKRLNTRDVRIKDRLFKERSEIIETLMRKCPGFKPPADWRPPKKERKVFIPQKDYPGYNFIGLIIGPRGNTQKRLQRETNTKIAIRGKGSVKEGQARDPRFDYGEDEDLHVLVTGDTDENVERAVEEVNKLLEPSDEQMNQHKRDQLRELAMINGTLKDNECCYLCGKPGHMQFDCPERGNRAHSGPKDPVTCRICGEGGHIAADCPLRNTEEAQKLSDEYKSFLQEIGVEGEANIKGAPNVEALQQSDTKPKFRKQQEPDDSKLYIGNLPESMTEERLKELFADQGEVIDVKVVPHKHYGFVRFSNKDHAAGAIEVMHGKEVDGHSLVVRIAGHFPGKNKQAQSEDPYTKLYVAYLPLYIDSDRLREMFEPYGQVTEAKIIYEPNGGPSKGYGFVKFETQDAAANAIYSLNGCPLEGRNIVVKVAGKNVHQPYRSFPPPSAQAGGGAYMNPYAQFYGGPMGYDYEAYYQWLYQQQQQPVAPEQAQHMPPMQAYQMTMGQAPQAMPPMPPQDFSAGAEAPPPPPPPEEEGAPPPPPPEEDAPPPPAEEAPPPPQEEAPPPPPED